MNSLTFAAPTLVVVTAVAILIGAGWLSLENWRRSGRLRMTGFLESVRLLLIILLLVSLLRPEYVHRIERKTTPEIAILTDASGSMTTRDVVSTNAVISRADWLKRQTDQQFWKPLEAHAKVSVEPFAAPATNSSALIGTDLNGALEDALIHHKNLKAVLLLSDGDWNLGKSPLAMATRFREENVPIFTVAVGRETPVPDLILENVSAPAFGLFGEQIVVPFKVVSHLAHEVKTSVSLSDQFGEAAHRDITIPPNGTVEDSVLWSARAAGEVTATVKVPVQPDEGIAENNERSFHISIRVDKLRVLVVDSLPRWEYRYLRNALARDPGIDLKCLLFHPEIGPGDGIDYIQSFPNTKEELAPFDVVFLGDVGIGQGELTEEQAALVKGLVEQQSSGLIFLPGQRGRELSLLNTPLKDLYPVVLDETKPEGIGLFNESQLLLTTIGKQHWLTRFDADESRNDEIWKQLPGFYWSAAVLKSRPGSQVLAVHSDLRNDAGRIPLLVTRVAGSGNVLFMGTDSAWRWRRGVEDKYHYRFWGQVVRWMAHQRHLSEKEGIRLSYSPESPQAGDTVYLQSAVLDDAGFPIEQGPVTGKITAPSGRAERLDFIPLQGGWGVFKSSFQTLESGKYSIEVSSDKYSRHLQTDLLVSRPQIEKVGDPINAQVLREISSITRGSSFTADDFEQAVQKISLLPEQQPLERRVRLWSNPIWGGAILFLLTLYWIGRKWSGLI